MDAAYDGGMDAACEGGLEAAYEGGAIDLLLLELMICWPALLAGLYLSWNGTCTGLRATPVSMLYSPLFLPSITLLRIKDRTLASLSTDSNFLPSLLLS